MPLMRVCALFSGGKDSTYALHWAFLKGFEVVCLLTLRPRNIESMLFHYPNVEWTEKQAKALEIPQVIKDVRSIGEEEVEELSGVLEEVKAEFKIEGIVVGALLSDYQRMRFNIAAHPIGLRVYAPLWRKRQDAYMRELIRHGFKFALTSIAVEGLDVRLLGKELNENDVESIIQAAYKYGFNPALEGGEGETFVLDAPLFRYRLIIENGEVVRLGPNTWVFRIRSLRAVEKCGQWGITY